MSAQGAAMWQEPGGHRTSAPPVSRTPSGSPSAASHVPVSRLNPVRDASDLRRLILLVESIRPKLVHAGLSADVADELLARLRSELQRITPTEAT